jgi:hypothetical protein
MALGPLRMSIAAPRETVFDVIAAPYLGRTPRAMGAKLDVLERGSDGKARHRPRAGSIAAATRLLRSEAWTSHRRGGGGRPA